MQRWTATTIKEALDLLDAAKKQLEAQILAMAPGADFRTREETVKTTPVDFTIEFDLSTSAERVRDRHAFAEQIKGLDVHTDN